MGFSKASPPTNSFQRQSGLQHNSAVARRHHHRGQHATSRRTAGPCSEDSTTTVAIREAEDSTTTVVPRGHILRQATAVRNFAVLPRPPPSSPPWRSSGPRALGRQSPPLSSPPWRSSCSWWKKIGVGTLWKKMAPELSPPASHDALLDGSNDEQEPPHITARSGLDHTLSAAVQRLCARPRKVIVPSPYLRYQTEHGEVIRVDSVLIGDHGENTDSSCEVSDKYLVTPVGRAPTSFRKTTCTSPNQLVAGAVRGGGRRRAPGGYTWRWNTEKTSARGSGFESERPGERWGHESQRPEGRWKRAHESQRSPAGVEAPPPRVSDGVEAAPETRGGGDSRIVDGSAIFHVHDNFLSRVDWDRS